MVSIGIVGLGKWGKNLLRDFSSMCEVKTCCVTKISKNLNWLKKNYPKIKITFQYEEILNDETINAVIIATPIDFHYKFALKALKAGKHVFVEKPIATTIHQANYLVNYAKKKNLILFVGHVFLYHPVFQKIQQIVKNDPISHVIFQWNKFGTFKESIIWNLLSHEIALAIEIFGKPKNITNLYKIGFLTKIDIIFLKLDFPKNRTCFFSINRVSDAKTKSIIFSTRKNLYIWKNDILFKLNRKNLTFKKIFSSKKRPLLIECNKFISSIRKKKRTSTSGEQALQVVKILSKLRN